MSAVEPFELTNIVALVGLVYHKRLDNQDAGSMKHRPFG